MTSAQMAVPAAGLSDGTMPVPNFLIVGAAKSGTTSLHHYLAQHPDLFMCPRKDTFFFNCDEGVRPDYGGPGDNAWYESRAVVTREAYQALFDGVTAERAVGEACTQYLYDPRAPARIQRALPHAKIIAVLRDPVARAYSSFLQQVRDGHETTSDFAAALALEEERIAAGWRPLWHYRARGCYFEQLTRYFECFGAEQIKVCLYEDLQQEPLALLEDIFAFLQVDRSFRPDTSVRHNRAGIPRSRALHRLIMTPNPLKSLVKPLLPGKLRRMVKAAVTDSQVNLRKPALPEEVRQLLIAGYRDDILKTQDLIRRDLSAWLT